MISQLRTIRTLEMVKIRIFTPDTIDECELERMKVMQLNEVQKLVRSSYKGTVTSLL